MEAHPVIHPSADVIRAFALGKLDNTSSEGVMIHLDGCPDCFKQVAALSGDDFLVRLRQAHGRSFTPVPAKSLADIAQPPKPPVKRTPIPDLPRELANNPQYDVLCELGRGGMGVVYLAKNKLMDRLEVLKVINKSLLVHADSVERFLREIRSAAKLNHANVVAAYSAVQQGELLAFAMEYIEGEDLAKLVRAQGPLPVAHACYYTQQTALGLQHAFEKGMVHRDIKPQNLILARVGKKHIVKVLDFGLAKVMREKSEDTGLTGEGQMLGTPDYIAPEQTLDAANADIRADIYSLGCTLYYLLTGAPPFKGRSLYEILQAHQSMVARPLNLARPEVPEELAAIVRKMMAKDPAKRYQTPAEVAQALALFIKPGAKAALPKQSAELSVGEPEAKAECSVALASESVRRKAATTQVPAAAGLDTMTEGTSRSVARQKSKTVVQRRPPAVKLSSMRKWLIGGGVGVGVLLLLLLGLFAGGGFKGKTPEGTTVLENLPAHAEHNRGDQKLADLLIEGSVWKGPCTFLNLKDVAGAELVLYVQSRKGSAFTAVHAYRQVINGLLKERFLALVQGNATGDVLDYHPTIPPHSQFNVTGTLKSGYLEISFEDSHGVAATAKLKLQEARPKSATCVLSVFDRDDSEGWHTLNQDGTTNATQPIQVHGNQHDVHFWLFARFIPNRKEWGWHAPDKFHGDHSGKFGRFLIYSIHVTSARKTLPTDWYVCLRGASMTIYLDGTALEPPASLAWKHYSVRLDASAGWKKYPGGRTANDEEIKEVLADVTDLRIKGEYGLKSDGCLDKVEFGAEDPFIKN